ncbi:MAG: hypothetical protein PHD43_19170 [Methylococcales bacterium]|nr:hypothetical protein [Methylococcales bacterium]
MMTAKIKRLFFVLKPCLVAAILALWALQLWAMPARAGEANPLKPIDTSSPRATLQGFIEFMNEGYGTGIGVLESYLASSKLYLSSEELAIIKGSMRFRESAQRALDLDDGEDRVQALDGCRSICEI